MGELFLSTKKFFAKSIHSLLHTNEDMLLPADQDLLHIDATKLGKFPAKYRPRSLDCQYELSPMNSAISAGRLHRARRGSRVRLPRICRRRSVQTEPQQSIDSEDSDYETEEEEQHTPPSPVL
mmetsp:Transcript_23253/g.46364  ORF Transcript_23253/g.46364 Transcript_23253/m.46364 type:complete len:123 (-) Transcript_23253:8-376(-)